MPIVQFHQAKVSWRARRTPKGHWVAVCDSLRLTVEADTWDELNASINEALQLLMIDLIEGGDVMPFLRQQGWTPTTALPKKAGSRTKFDIPWTVTQDGEKAAAGVCS